MKKNTESRRLKLFCGLCLICLLQIIAAAQTGGSYDLSQNVIAGGGGSNSAGGQFSLDGTIGQALAGTLSTGGSLSLRGGFWAESLSAPTAAPVSLGGRVSTAFGKAFIRRARVTLIDTFTGLTRSTQTNRLGYYRFEELEVGRFYIVRAESKSFFFTPDSYSLELTENREDINFTGERVLSISDEK